MVKQYKQNRTTKEDSINNLEMTGKHIKNRMQEKPNDFGLKCPNGKNKTEKPNR